MSPPSLAPSRCRAAASPKIQALHHTMTHTGRVYLYRLSLSVAADIFSLIWNGSRVSASVHIESREEGREAAAAVSVCVVGAPTALLAAPIKTRPRHLASLYNAPSLSGPRPLAVRPLHTDCKETRLKGREADVPGQKCLIHRTLICEYLYHR